MLYANSSYTFLLFFSISRSIFTSSPIYREHPDNLYWNNTIPVGEIIKSQLRKEREREEESLENLISLESRLFQVFHHSPPLIRFRSFKNFSAERKHCTEGHTGTRSDGSTTDGAQPSRSSPASARVSARTARRPLFTAGFPSSWKFRGALYFA